MKRTILLSLLFAVCCAAGFVAIWLVRDALGGWAVPVALGWVVLVSKGFAVGLALRGADR
jgi:hypothetical protein